MNGEEGGSPYSHRTRKVKGKPKPPKVTFETQGTLLSPPGSEEKKKRSENIKTSTTQKI